MVDSIARFISVLDRVPAVLLTTEDARVLNDAKASAGVLESIENSPVAVVLVGGSGVGKSHLMNDIVGMAASEVSVLRPTTTSVVMASSCGPAKVDHASEYVFAPNAPDTIAIVDTPAPDTDMDAVEAALRTADIGVLVVSPARYADAATHELWAAMEGIPEKLVVLNRLGGSQSERTELVTSVVEHFTAVEVLEVDEGGIADNVREAIIELAIGRSSSDGRAAIARTTAVEAGRFVASALTASALELGALAKAVESVDVPEISGKGLRVLESWLATHQELGALVHRSIDELDRQITESVRTGLAHRMADSLGQWDGGLLESDLDGWRDDAAGRFRSGRKFRWRRSFTEQLLDQASWKIGVNPTVRVVGRVKRVMGTDIGPITTEIHSSLVSIMNAAIVERHVLWRTAINETGSFKPGELLAAVESIDG